MDVMQIDPVKLKELRERIRIAAEEFDKQLDENAVCFCYDKDYYEAVAIMDEE